MVKPFSPLAFIMNRNYQQSFSASRSGVDTVNYDVVYFRRSIRAAALGKIHAYNMQPPEFPCHRLREERNGSMKSRKPRAGSHIVVHARYSNDNEIS